MAVTILNVDPPENTNRFLFSNKTDADMIVQYLADDQTTVIGNQTIPSGDEGYILDSDLSHQVKYIAAIAPKPAFTWRSIAQSKIAGGELPEYNTEDVTGAVTGTSVVFQYARDTYAVGALIVEETA